MFTEHSEAPLVRLVGITHRCYCNPTQQLHPSLRVVYKVVLLKLVAGVFRHLPSVSTYTDKRQCPQASSTANEVHPESSEYAGLHPRDEVSVVCLLSLSGLTCLLHTKPSHTRLDRYFLYDFRFTAESQHLRIIGDT